jgi:glyoxylase-like metal-dependent hydrolase (beta-lactamase superfamily II)
MLKRTQYDDVTRFDLARTMAGRGRYWTTAYLVDGMMIDTGCAFTARELAVTLKDAPLVRIVNTHSHEDHIGANARLQREHGGLEIVSHPLALLVLADPRGAQPLQPYRRLFWGLPEPSRGKSISDGAVLDTEHHRFQVIYTPGHSTDHLCLYELDEGWLFTGDLYVGGHDRAARCDYDVWQSIASLKRIAALPATWLFPGSARVREHPAADLAAKIDYLETLGERVLELHRQGRSVREIVRALCGGPMWIEFVTLGHFARRWLVLSYLRMNVENSPADV